MHVIIYSGNKTDLPFFWTGQGWAHTIAAAMRFDSIAEAEVERWNHAGTDSAVATVQ